MTEQFHRLYERVKKVNDDQKRFYKKVYDYNEGIMNVKNNLQSLIKPTEELKDKFKQEQLKSEDKSYLYTFDKVKDFVNYQTENVFDGIESGTLLLDTMKNQNIINNNEYEELYNTYVDTPPYNFSKENIPQDQIDKYKLNVREIIF